MTLSNLVTIDPIGNLLILTKVQNKPTHYFRVSSKILSLASPLLASLFPDAASHSGQYQLVINEENPSTVEKLLRICHFEHRAPFSRTLIEDIHLLAELSVKYEIVTPVLPWISAWTEQLPTLIGLDFSDEGELQKWLMLACVYNQGSLFLEVTRQAILTCSEGILDESKWEYPYKKIIGQLFAGRVNALSKLTAVALALLGRYQITETICTQSEQCDVILLGSVLKGLMGLSLYHPIPEAPYPGMTVMRLINQLEKFPFMYDTAHESTCGVTIENERKDITRLANATLSGVQGLDLNAFSFKQGWGQVGDLALTPVANMDDTVRQRQVYNQEVVEALEQLQEFKKGHWQDQEFLGAGNDSEIEVEIKIETEDLPETVIIDTKDDFESVTSVVTELPAGTMDGFLETEETLKDFGPQKFFGASQLGQTPTQVFQEEEMGGKGREGEPDGEEMKIIKNSSMAVLTKKDENQETPSTTELLTEQGEKVEKSGSPVTAKNLIIQGNELSDSKFKTHSIEQRQSMLPEFFGEHKEKLGPEPPIDLTPTFPLGPAPPERNRNRMPRPRVRDELNQPLRQVPAQHIASRANAEAKGEQWETPGPQLVQKYQRGPRFPFHPEVTVRDISEPDHTAEIKRLKELFPQIDTKIIFEFLRQNNWNSEVTIKKLNGLAGFPVLEPAILCPQNFPGSSLKTSEVPASDLKRFSGDSTTNPPDQEIPRGACKYPEGITNDSQLVQKSSTADSGTNLQPKTDNAALLRAVKIPENSLAIKKLLALFPAAKADKAFIDILYQAEWDFERAAGTLEGLGLVRKVSNGRSKGKAKSPVKGEAKAKGNGDGK